MYHNFTHTSLSTKFVLDEPMGGENMVNVDSHILYEKFSYEF